MGILPMLILRDKEIKHGRDARTTLMRMRRLAPMAACADRRRRAIIKVLHDQNTDVLSLPDDDTLAAGPHRAPSDQKTSEKLSTIDKTKTPI
ncbi:hypothetical protein JXA32_00920 [Candidatus Sumerlaeota bacterium]|nr:hypothetical protein [Candidatus Sumerlaeota bacterium]